MASLPANEGGRRQVEALIQRFGCLPAAPDGPILTTFEPLEMAQALESEIARSSDYGWAKITLHMDMPDAKLLAAFLRKNAGKV